MKNTLTKTAIVVLSLGLTATSDVLALGNSAFDQEALAEGAFKANHPNVLPGKSSSQSITRSIVTKESSSKTTFGVQGFKQPTFNKNQFVNDNINNQHLFKSGKRSFAQQQQSLGQSFGAGNKIQSFNNNNPQFIHPTPSFNNNTITVANNTNHPITFNNANNKVIQTGNISTHVVSTGANTNTIIHTTTTQHVGPRNGNVVMQEPGPVIMRPANKPIISSNGTRPIAVNSPITINNNHNNVIVNRGYGYNHGYNYGYNNYGYHHYYYGGSPIIIAPYPYYNNGYYNNNVNDFLAIALGLSLIGNVAQFAAAQSHTNNTVVYQNYPTYPPYSANAMSVYQPIPYAPTAYSSTGNKGGTTSSTSSQPVNVTVNTTVNTTTPATTPNGPTTTTSTQSTTTATPTTTTAANGDGGGALGAVTAQVTPTSPADSNNSPTMVADASSASSNPLAAISGNVDSASNDVVASAGTMATSASVA
jgi:hypothetical protein